MSVNSQHSLFQYNIPQLEKYFLNLFDETKAVDSESNFQLFLKTIITDLAVNLDVNLDLIEKDLCDPVVCKTRHLGCLKALTRILLPLAEAANYKATNDPDWSLLAGRIETQRLKLLVPKTFGEMMNENRNIWTSEYYQFCMEHLDELEQIIKPERDYDLYFFGVRTLEKSYLMRLFHDEHHFLETPQRMYLRIATFLQMPNLAAIEEYYDLMSMGYFTHASPTMFHSGINKGSLASCFLLTVQDDLENIFKCLGQCAQISKSAGGIGLDITNIRHSSVSHTGQSSGIVPMLKVYDACMRYVDQNGRRKGSATIFLQPWHIDFPDFLLLKRQHGSEERRARDLFYSVWNCDIFMERVQADKEWTLFCPKYAPMLTRTFGEEFEKWYLFYEDELPHHPFSENFVKKISARKLWNELLTSQIETGMPFMTNKDTANRTSNQQNLGLIRSSNLCQEILEVTDENTISSCNLASICLDEYVEMVDGKPFYNFEKLGQITRLLVRGLNNVIDRTFYPLSNGENGGPIKTTNLKYRPLGIGVQALADAFLKMDLAWTYPEARELNKQIFATIYYYAVDESVELAKQYGPYDGFKGSPASMGLLKPDLFWMEKARKKLRAAGVKATEELVKTKANEMKEAELVGMYDWNELSNKVKEYGLRNSLLIALMPTASSAQIRYKNESFEPFTSNMYVRTVLSGNHLIVNKHMVQDLKKLGLWNKKTINGIIAQDGSIRNLVFDHPNEKQIKHLQEKYATAFEISQKLIVQMSIDRAAYVCQSQSLNIHIKNPTFGQLTSLHFFAWENALSTGMYYLRTAPSTEAIKFTVEGELDVKKTVICTDDICVMCTA